MNAKRITSLLFSILLITQIFSQGSAPRMEAKIDQVQNLYGLTGEGVLTVMMDRGIDYRHPDFIDADGNTRIAYIFDLYDNSGTTASNNPYGVGTIYTRDQINASLVDGGTPLNNDIFGHGTATTGIICGNGSAAPFSDRYRGVAYKSDIVVIVVTRDYVPPFESNPGQDFQFDPNLLETAFEFAHDKITEIAKPSVTLLNIGSIGDPTDGSVAFCDITDNFVAQGHTFVCGVGDDGGAANHAVTNLTMGEITEFRVRKGTGGNLRFNAWYNENDRFQLRITRPNGLVEGPFSPPQNSTSAEDLFLPEIQIYHRGADVEFSGSDSNLRQLLIDLLGSSGEYLIQLETTSAEGDGQIDAYLNPALYYNNNRFLNHVSSTGSINSYSSCLSTISPGDYVIDNSWVDINGEERQINGEGMQGELWIGSSSGGTMDGRLGIDLVAPGEVCAAAYSLDSFYGYFESNVLQNSNGYYGIQNAVSAAAPITTGVIALMLEANPALTPEQIKQILQETAKSDSFTGGNPNEFFGHGKLDALAAVNAARDLVSVEENNLEESPFVVSPNPFTERININYKDGVQIINSISIYDIQGRLIWNQQNFHGTSIETSHLDNGTYLLETKTEKGIFVEKIIKF